MEVVEADAAADDDAIVAGAAILGAYGVAETATVLAIISWRRAADIYVAAVMSLLVYEYK